MEIDVLLKILQASIVPCVLISGIGLLLLSVTNRLARPIDRIRLLCHDFKRMADEEQLLVKQQIDILYLRARLLRAAITLLTLGIFLLSAIILASFCIFILHWPLEWFIEVMFVASLLAMIAGLLFFLLDIRLALRSIKLEIQRSTS